MIAIRCRFSPVLAHAVKNKRHTFAINPKKPIIKVKEIEKMKLIVSWNLRATQSALKNCEEMEKILEDLNN
jgi:hypothetical protein|tara:strand:+ start:96 stop:308 length:213 start_codon:yes stop_codon:yes gene_type:complete